MISKNIKKSKQSSNNITESLKALNEKQIKEIVKTIDKKFIEMKKISGKSFGSVSYFNKKRLLRITGGPLGRCPVCGNKID
jgi:hypothetical protein